MGVNLDENFYRKQAERVLRIAEGSLSQQSKAEMLELAASLLRLADFKAQQKKIQRD